MTCFSSSTFSAESSKPCNCMSGIVAVVAVVAVVVVAVVLWLLFMVIVVVGMLVLFNLN